MVIDNTIDFIFDQEVIEGLADRVVKWLQKDNTTVLLLQRELAEVEQALDNVMRAVEQGIINSTTRKRMSELEERKTDLQVKIAREEIQANILTKEQVIFWLSNMQKLNLATAENRQRIIDTFINSIHVYDDRLVINFNCREESETIPLELSKKVSRLRESGEPITLIYPLIFSGYIFCVLIYRNFYFSAIKCSIPLEIKALLW